jgi:hypothetical protein
MKLDKNKPYGVISGDHPAAYEQNGEFFDAEGELVAGGITVADQPPATLDAEQFLRDMLAGGPVAQTNLYKEAGLRDYNWPDVKTAAAALNVRIAPVGGKPTWSLN